ncbi:NADH-quinone oxidoreductase subunit NuoE [Buchnera aphidicola]|uniref:NADH-quinone oxidoreductase subunit NuoE n=1 Tax=Buchnera aphidicola TaxID=9 RepID=UPI0031B8992A
MINNKLTDIELSYISEEKRKYKHTRAIIIEVLKMVQRTRGWISDEIIQEISQVLCIPICDIEELSTFYSQIYRQPVGRHIIKFCDSVVCYMLGSSNIKKCLTKSLYIQPGETTKNNRFTLLPISCLGNCDKAPTIMIDNDTYSNVQVKNILILLEKYK